MVNTSHTNVCVIGKRVVASLAQIVLWAVRALKILTISERRPLFLSESYDKVCISYIVRFVGLVSTASSSLTLVPS